MGVGEAFAQFLNNLGDSTKIVVANVEPAPGFESRIQPSQIIRPGRSSSASPPSSTRRSLEKLTDPDKADLLPSIKRPDEVLAAVLAELEPKSDYQVLMVQGPPELAKRLATAYPGFDVVVATSPFADPLEREPGCSTAARRCWSRSAGAASTSAPWASSPTTTQKMRFHLVTLGNRERQAGLADEEAHRGRVPQHAQGRRAWSRTSPATTTPAAPPGATFVGAETCKPCHPNTYMKWSTTKHAQAFEPLRDDPKPNTIYDAECVTCHTTGFEYTSG